MKQATKGAMAAVTAVALLSGGAGTLAYWTGTADVTGGSIASGKLKLSTPVCDGSVTGTHEWQYAGGGAFTLGSSKVVPGDTLTRVCQTTLDMSGDHIAATLSLSQPTFATSSTDSLDTELTPTASFVVDNATYTGGTISGTGTHTVLATVTVTFDSATATNTSQAVAATLSNATITATQTHV